MTRFPGTCEQGNERVVVSVVARYLLGAPQPSNCNCPSGLLRLHADNWPYHLKPCQHYATSTTVYSQDMMISYTVAANATLLLIAAATVADCHSGLPCMSAANMAVKKGVVAPIA